MILRFVSPELSVNTYLQKFTTPKFLENKYGIWLIGYDGNIKDYSSDDKIFFRLFNLIDSMPMRKSEIEKDTC